MKERGFSGLIDRDPFRGPDHGALAEYERELLLERTKAGRALAEKQGKICHRPRKEIDPKVPLLHQMMAKIEESPS